MKRKKKKNSPLANCMADYDADERLCIHSKSGARWTHTHVCIGFAAKLFVSYVIDAPNLERAVVGASQGKRCVRSNVEAHDIVFVPCEPLQLHTFPGAPNLGSAIK